MPATCRLTGTMRDPGSNPLPRAKVVFERLPLEIAAQAASVIVPNRIETTASVGGIIGVDLLPGVYLMTTLADAMILQHRVPVPDQETADLGDLLEGAPDPEIVTAAQVARDLARRWADAPENDPVVTDPDGFSALHHAAKARVSALAAIAAVNALGPVRVTVTYADAVAALPGLTNGDIVEVSIDETRTGRRARYRVVAAALEFVVYLDSQASNLLRGPTSFWLSALTDMPALPNRRVMFAVDDLIDDLVRDGIWGKLRMLTLPLLPDAIAAAIDLRDPAIRWTADPAAIHDPGFGWRREDGAADAVVLTSNAAPSDLVLRDDAAFGVWVSGQGTSPAVLWAPGVSITTTDAASTPVRVNQAAAWLPDVAHGTVGMVAAVRSGASTITHYRDGLAIAATTSTPSDAAPSATPLQIRRGVGSHACGVAFAGVGLTSTDIHALTVAVTGLRFALGVI